MYYPAIPKTAAPINPPIKVPIPGLIQFPI
jgi:hypothetical protein